MTRCTVCGHPRLSEINKALVLGVGLRQTSNKFAEWGRVSTYALHRHLHGHISDKAKAAIIAGNQSRQDAIDLGELRETTEKRNLADLMFHRNVLEAEINNARNLGDFTAISSLEGRLLQNIEQTSRLIGELPTAKTTINLVTTADDWPDLQRDLLTLARTVPAARGPLLQLVHKRAGYVPGFARKTLARVEASDELG